MDTARAEQLGARPLAAELARIDAVKNAHDAVDVAFALRPLQVSAFFGVSVDQDEKSSGEMTVHLSQGGLGLPDRDFYFNTEAGVSHIRDEYVAHIARTLKLHQPGGDPNPRPAGDGVRGGWLTPSRQRGVRDPGTTTV
jgi:putative endopeptidase